MAKFDTQKLIEHLSVKWKQKPCPLCGGGPWNVQDTTYQLMEFSEGGALVLGGPILPVIPVICANCGNTVLVNAVVSKVINPSVPPPKEEPK
jgi:hypothetical protein